MARAEQKGCYSSEVEQKKDWTPHARRSKAIHRSRRMKEAHPQIKPWFASTVVSAPSHSRQVPARLFPLRATSATSRAPLSVAPPCVITQRYCVQRTREHQSIDILPKELVLPLWRLLALHCRAFTPDSGGNSATALVGSGSSFGSGSGSCCIEGHTKYSRGAG